MASYASAETDIETGVLTVLCEGHDPVTINLTSLDANIQRRLALHGLKQKVVDSYSGAKKAVEEGDAESEAVYAYEAATSTIQQLIAGEWSARREGGSRVSMLAQAIAAATGKALEAIAAQLAEMDDDKKKAISKIPAVQLQLARLRKESEERREAKLRKEAEAAGSTGLEAFA